VLVTCLSLPRMFVGQLVPLGPALAKKIVPCGPAIAKGTSSVRSLLVKGLFSFPAHNF
jgi:hypothetical protein